MGKKLFSIIPTYQFVKIIYFYQVQLLKLQKNIEIFGTVKSSLKPSENKNTTTKEVAWQQNGMAINIDIQFRHNG